MFCFRWKMVQIKNRNVRIGWQKCQVRKSNRFTYAGIWKFEPQWMEIDSVAVNEKGNVTNQSICLSLGFRSSDVPVQPTTAVKKVKPISPWWFLRSLLWAFTYPQLLWPQLLKLLVKSVYTMTCNSHVISMNKVFVLNVI